MLAGVEHRLNATHLFCVSLQAGKGIADKVAALLHYWEGKYKHLWEQDKDAYMRCVLVFGCSIRFQG